MSVEVKFKLRFHVALKKRNKKSFILILASVYLDILIIPYNGSHMRWLLRTRYACAKKNR